MGQAGSVVTSALYTQSLLQDSALSELHSKLPPSFKIKYLDVENVIKLYIFMCNWIIRVSVFKKTFVLFSQWRETPNFLRVKEPKVQYCIKDGINQNFSLCSGIYLIFQ